MTQSANDAAVTIAENFGGTEENFATLMTDKARQHRHADTLFRNASGLPDDEQITTARDMAMLARASDPATIPEYYTVFATVFHLPTAGDTAITTSCCSAIRAPTASRPAIRARAASTSRLPRIAATSTSSPSCLAAGPGASATPRCARCSTSTLPQPRHQAHRGAARGIVRGAGAAGDEEDRLRNGLE